MKFYLLILLLLAVFGGLLPGRGRAEILSPLIEPVEVQPPHRIQFEAGLFAGTDRELHDGEAGPREFSTTSFQPIKISANPGFEAVSVEVGISFAHHRENYDGNYKNRTAQLGPFIYLKNQFSSYFSLVMGVGGTDSNELLAHNIPDLKFNIPFRIPLTAGKFLYGESGYQVHSGSPEDYNADYANRDNYGLGIERRYPAANSRVFLEFKSESAPLENHLSYRRLQSLAAGTQFPLENLFFTQREGSVTSFVSHGLAEGSPDVAAGLIFSLNFEDRERGR